ncbi:unnamed protein product [Thelazia callipaeda]|uniref:Origin recognition complex subunit 1 n=1 Tax=Thelazia callipaeda TaxID=103827 RepID=A0A0N5CWZ5_THECL|nr:unnamed protein product [Thelazia callipaeda]
MSDYQRTSWNRKSGNSASVGVQGNKTVKSRRIMPKRKAKLSSSVCDQNMFDVHSPVKKRRRISEVLQQSTTVPNAKLNMNLDEFGFEIESEEVALSTETSQLSSLCTSGVSSPLPSTVIALPKILDRKILEKPGTKSGFGEERIIISNTVNDNLRNIPRAKDLHAIPQHDSEATGKNGGSVAEPNEREVHSVVSLGRAVRSIRKAKSVLEEKTGKKGFERDIVSEFSSRKTLSTQVSQKNVGNSVYCCAKSFQKVETVEDIYRRLQTSEIPERLPCREAEFEQICSFIKGCTGSGAVSQTMYVSGVPGTGKTATVLQAVRYCKLVKNIKFSFITVNAMELDNPKQVFVQIYQNLLDVNKKIASNVARKKLNEIFQYRDRKRLPVIILVDEVKLDLLKTTKQEIIYDIFNWSANEESAVSVIAIANTLDLPERLLSRRISSRLGANRLCFQPYGHEEVGYIIRDRLQGSSAVEAEAVELSSRKVAAVSGDLRKALDIMRNAAQLALTAKQKQITMKNVQEAIRLASTNVRVDLIRSLPLHSILLLRAALAEQITSGLDEFEFRILFKQYQLQCSVENIIPISTSSAYRNVMEMCSERLLVAIAGTGIMSRRLCLGMTTHDVQLAFKQVDKLPL